MKHIKLFESFEDIDSICRKYGIEYYTINPDGSVDVDGDVYLHDEELTKLPLKFGRVSGHFNCSQNQLITLEGAPESVGATFNCSDNKLTTLEGSPESVVGNFYCTANKLTTLKGGPRKVTGWFYCAHNQLTILEIPKEAATGFYLNSNPIYEIYKLFNNSEDFGYSLDWNYLRKDKETNQVQIVKSIFTEACAEAGIEVPESIDGYEYI